VPRLGRDLDRRLAHEPEASILETHPHLFSDAPVFIDSVHVAAMRELIEAVHAVIKLPGFVQAALATAPAIARRESAALGVFTGFDFHITADGPKLIEINTNAGGALLNAVARGAQPPCCPGADDVLGAQPGADALQRRFVDMFLREWTLSRGHDRRLRTIAIVDDDPQRQYLLPEFRLFQRLFESHGIEAFIADPRELRTTPTALELRGQPIDLVYNRLTDFYLEAPEHQSLRTALESDLSVITPHPRTHALLANKRNLALLTDPVFLGSIGASARHVATLLKSIPRTVLVTDSADRWWAERKGWFFKPAQGYGSRGTYRGDKLTKRVFTEVMNGQYVAQELALPSERERTRPGGREAYKLDIRHYTYDGATQLVAARLYQGQTTNFRTAGGGFAPVYELGSPEDLRRVLERCATGSAEDGR
jgi:hypothetical protein